MELSGLDLFSVQQAIYTYLDSKLTWDVSTGGVPEAETIKFKNGVLEPYVVLRFSELMPSSRGASWGGAIYYEYYSYVDALCVGRTDTDSRELASAVNRMLMGKKFSNTSEIRKNYGGGLFSVPDATRIPIAYVAVASFVFGTNLENVGSGSLVT